MFATYHTNCNYGDIITIPGCPYPHDGLVFYIGILAQGIVPDVEGFRTWIYDLGWPGSIEDMMEQIVLGIQKSIQPKGMLVVCKSSLFSTQHASAIDEVRQDCDVKEEMYRLMGL